MNAIPSLGHPDCQPYYRFLKRHVARISPNTGWLCQMLASWRNGLGALPDGLGLDADEFRELIGEFFHSLELSAASPRGGPADYSRMLEREDLIRYLMSRAAYPERRETGWIASILVAGCLGNDHLWQDLGLWSRQELSNLIAHNFPPIARANHQNMKWKKFLYKQLCEAEGIYVCRAPSCAVCVDYAQCFGPEE